MLARDCLTDVRSAGISHSTSSVLGGAAEEHDRQHRAHRGPHESDSAAIGTWIREARWALTVWNSGLATSCSPETQPRG